MFTAEQYRAKAIDYSNLLTMPNGASELREYQRLKRSFTELADNAQWLADNPASSRMRQRTKPHLSPSTSPRRSTRSSKAAP